MGSLEIPFNRETARSLKDAFALTADALDGQVTRRSAAAEKVLNEFRGPYADVFKTNAETAATDIASISKAMREVGYLMDRAIEAYDEYMEDAQKSDWEEFVDKCRDFFGFNPEEELPPAPSLPPVASPSTSSKDTPSGVIGGAATVSGIPQEIRGGVTDLGILDSLLEDAPGRMTGAVSAYDTACSWAPVNVGNIPQALTDWLDANKTEQTWLGKIADELERISGDPAAAASVPYSTIEAAVGNTSELSRKSIKVDTPTIQGSEGAAGYIGDPVNAATGNFIEPETDLAFTGASAALALTRMYNAGDSNVGVFGLGWSSPLDMRLILTDENATWVKEDGQHLIFPRQGEGWDRAHLHALWLTREDASQLPVELASAPAEVLVVRDNQGEWWAFTPAGEWLAHGATTGDAVTATRNASGEITRLQHVRGRFIDIEYSDGRVAYAQSHDGTRVEYFYSVSGLLTGVSTPVGTRYYAHNEENLICSVTAADGTVEVENFYDSLGRVRSQKYPHGVVRKYSYLSNGVTLVTNEDGSHANSWISDSHGRLVGMIDAQGNRQSMAYDTFNNRVSVTERDGSMTVRAYNKRGLLTREVTPEGADFTYEYDEHDRITTLVTASGAVVSYEYADASGADRNPSTLVDALGGRTEMVWEQGLLTSMVGPTGVAMTLTYDAFGDIVGVTNALGNRVSFERDSAGRVTKIVTPLGHTTSFTYDVAGQLLAREDADGALWRFTYGAGGQVKTVTDPLGAVTTLEYNSAGEVAQVIDPLGRETTQTFDAMGNIKSVLTAGGARWSFEYDELMQATAAIDPLGNKWLREFDVNGELAALVDPTGVRTTVDQKRQAGIAQVKDAFGTYTSHYDSYGRLVKDTGADGSEEIYTHDAAGNVVEILDAEGNLTLIGRDARGQITSITSPEDRVTTFTYDECGRPETMTEPTGVVTTLEYDADSRVVVRSTSAGEREELTYDAASRVIVQRTNSSTARYAYDACGRLTYAADLKFGIRRFAYDAAGQLVCATNGLGGKTRYTYTPDGQVASMTDPTGAVSTFTYDVAGQLVSSRDALGRVTTARYDKAGRLLGTTSPDGDRLEYTYDGAGMLATTRFNAQLLSRVERDAVSRTTRVFDYTGYGVSLVGEGQGAPVVHTLVADRLGRLAEHSTRGGLVGDGHSVRISYTPDGGRRTVDVDGVLTEYSYDEGTGLLSSLVRGASGESVFYHYDQGGHLSRVTDQAGAVLRSFDVVPTAVRVSDGAEGQGDGIDAGQPAYQADGGWAWVEHSTTASGEQVTRRTYYSAEGLIIGVDDSADGLRLFTYDDAHQLTGVVSSAGTHSFVYNDAGFLTREVTATGVTREYTYDAAGQLVRLDDSEAGVSEFVYDGLGRRVQHRRADGSVRDFAFSPVGLLAQVSDDGAPVVRLWNDALSQTAGVAGVDGSAPCELVWDLAAGVPTVLGAGGVPVSLAAGVGVDVLGARGVDPFAASPVVSEFGSGVAGGVTAAGPLQVAGLEVLGVRAYDPVSRGFMSPDPVVSPVGAGWGANVYSFVGNAPTAMVDPWGLSPMTATQFKEYRENTSGRAVERMGKGLENWANEHASQIAAVAIAAGTVLTVAALVATGPVGLIVAGAAGGAFLSGGLSILTNRGADGRVDWKKVGLDTLIGGALGALGGAGSAAIKATMAVTKSPTRFLGSLAVNTGINFTTGALGGGITYTAQAYKKGEPWNLRKFMGNTLGGGLGAAVSGFAGPASGTLSNSSPYLRQKATELSMNFLGGAASEGVNSFISGEDSSLRKVLVSGTASMGMSVIPVAKPTRSSTLNQASWFSPSTLHGAFNGVQARRMWTGGAQGSFLSAVHDLSIGDSLKGE